MLRICKDSFFARFISLLLCFSMILGSNQLMESVTAIAESVSDEADKYSVSITWRKDDNSGNADNPYVINEDESKREFIYMGINFRNLTSQPLMPGELTVNITGLADLGRNKALDIVRDDPVFTENWEIVSTGADGNSYVLRNKRPLSKQVLTTLHWEINSRDAVALEENENEELEHFMRTISASYEINRYKRNSEGECLDEDGNIIGDDGLLRDSEGRYARMEGGNLYGIIPTDEGDPTHGLLFDGEYYLSEDGYRLYKDGDGSYIKVDSDGHPITNGNGDPQTGVPVEGDAQYGVPVLEYDGEETATNSLDFEYFSEHDDLEMTVTGSEVTADEAEDLDDRYAWYNFRVSLNQEKKARGIHDSDLFVEIECPEGVSPSDIQVLDKNGRPVALTTQTVDGEERLGFYVFKNKNGDINSYSADYCVGVLQSKIDPEHPENNILKFTGRARVLYNDEKESEPPLVETAKTTLEGGDEEEGTYITVPDYGDQFYDPNRLVFEKSNGKYENNNHTNPGSNSAKKLLSGNLFHGQVVSFDLGASIMKSTRQNAPFAVLTTGDRVREVLERSVSPSDEELAGDTLYDLVIGDDTLGIYFESGGTTRVLDNDEYIIQNVTIPKGIFHASGSDTYSAGDGYSFELYVSTDGGDTYPSEPTATGVTLKDSSQTISVNGNAFYLVIKDLDKIVNNKKFKVNVRFSLDETKEENQILLRSDSVFDESAARVVNYGFMQMIYEKDGSLYDLAARTSPYISGVNGSTVIEDTANSRSRELESGAYLRRSYSNVFLRTDITSISSKTEFTSPLSRRTHWDEGVSGSLEKWYGTVTTKGSLISDNPGTLRKFTVRAVLPEYLELRDTSLSMLRDSLVFSGVDFGSRAAIGSDDISSENTSFRLTENPDGTKTIEVEFDFTGNPLLASELTSVEFSYDVYVEDDNPYIDKTKPLKVNSYTELEDQGRKAAVMSGSNNGKLYNSNTVTSSASSSIGKTDIALETKLNKRVMTEFSKGLYLRDSQVRGSTEEIPSYYTYKLSFDIYGSEDGCVKEMVLVDKLEDYRKNSNDQSGYNTQWKGTLEYVDIGQALDDMGIPSHAAVYYTTSESAYFTDKDYEGDVDVSSDMTAHLNAANGWKLMESSENRMWYVPDSETEEVYAIAAVLLTDSDQPVSMTYTESGYIFGSSILVRMSAPEASDENINRMAVNSFFSLYTMDIFENISSDEYGYEESNVTNVAMINSLKIKKIDYDNSSKGLSGAEFEVKTFANKVEKADYLAHSNDDISISDITDVNYTVIDESSFTYSERTLENVEVDPQGIIRLNLAPGFYFIRETETPTGYDGDCELYYLIYFDDTGRAELCNTYDITETENGDVLSVFNSGALLVDDSDGVQGLISVRNKANAEGKARFTKIDEDTGLPLEGAKFRLLKYDDSGEAQQVGVKYDPAGLCYALDSSGTDAIISDEDGSFTISGLTVGTYVLEETVFPVGYEATDGLTVFQVRLGNIGSDGMIDLTESGQLSDVSEISNRQMRSQIRLVKHDENEADQSKNLAGARYSMYVLRGLDEFEDFSSYDDLLAAAKSEIYGWDGSRTLVYWTKSDKTLITDVSGTGTVDDIPFGTYFLYEELAPSGYKRNNNRNGYISSDPSISEGIITIDAESADSHANAADTAFSVTHNDVRKKGKAQVQKLSAADGTPLSGARFALLKKLGDTQNPPPLANYDQLENKDSYDTVIYHSGSYDFATDIDGWTEVIDNLEWGTYYFKEISAPMGFELTNETKEFRISAKTAGAVNRVFMDNDPKSGSVLLEKYEKGDNTKKLAGARFGLVEKLADGTSKRCSVVSDGGVYRLADSGETGAVTELVTDANGLISVTGLEWGTYEFIETVPPRGYATAVVESFTVDRESCGSQIYRKCEEPRASANILIDKYIDGGVDYSDAYGAPTFIYRITEINNMTEREPVANGMTYTEFMSFHAGDTEGHTTVSVAQGVYMIEEISVSRYEFKQLRTVSGDTNISDYSPAAGTMQTNSRVAYCDLEGDPSDPDFVPQYRAEYTNGIERYDVLSHVASAQNRFPAPNEYITGIRAVYDSFVPVSNTAGSTYRIPLDDIVISRINNKDEITVLTSAEKAGLTYTGGDGYNVTTVTEGGVTYLVVPNTRDYSLLSRTVTVTDGSGMTAELHIRYEGAKSDIKKYVTLRQDSDNLSYFGEDETSADVVFTKSADDGSITSNMSASENQLRIADNDYRFLCWQYEDEDGQLTGLTFNDEQEIQDFIYSAENEGVSAFTFVAQLEYNPNPTAKIMNTAASAETSFIQNLNWVAHTSGNDRYLRFRSFQHVDYDEGMAMWQRCLKNPDSTKVRYEINDLYDHEKAGNIHKAAIISVTRDPNNPEDPEYPDVVYLYAVNRTDTQADGYDVYWFSKSPRVLIDGSCKDLFYHGNKFVNLTDVSGVEDIDFSGVTTMERAFINCPALTSVTINSDFDNCITALSMFSGCTSLTDVTINGDFPKCESFRTMFSGDTSLKNVTFNSDLEHIHIFNQMFANCTSLESVVNLKDTTLRPYSSTSDDSFTYANNYNQSFKEMFLNCSSLTNIDFLKGADMSRCASVTDMFRGCTSLPNQELIDVIKTWTFSEDSPILTTATDDGAGNMNKSGFPAGWYECANGRVYIESGGKFRKNSFEPNP